MLQGQVLPQAPARLTKRTGRLRAENPQSRILFKAPGVAETLDWASALTELDAVALDPGLRSPTRWACCSNTRTILPKCRATKAQGLGRPGARLELKASCVSALSDIRAAADRTATASVPVLRPCGSCSHVLQSVSRSRRFEKPGRTNGAGMSVHGQAVAAFIHDSRPERLPRLLIVMWTLRNAGAGTRRGGRIRSKVVL